MTWDEYFAASREASKDATAGMDEDEARDRADRSR